MVRVLSVTTALLMFAASYAHAAVDAKASLELAAVDAGPLRGFPAGTHSKLRYGRADGPLKLSAGYAQATFDLHPSWHLKVAVDVNDEQDHKLGFTEAYVQYRPLPIDGVRWRARIGALRPPVSFEHGADGWATLYTTNASAINSWVGEELGGLALEVSARRDRASTGGDWTWAAAAAALYGNDTSGTLLSWRGWSLNNWQTPWGGKIRLPELPIFDRAADQAPRSEPFLELDNRPGYWAWAELGQPGRWRARASWYDNRAQLDAAGHHQLAWRTRFANLGVQLALPGSIGLVAQWMSGRTVWGPQLSFGRVLDNPFEARFGLLTRLWGRHRTSVRYDWFSVTDDDNNPGDPNDERGTGLTLSYQYRMTANWLVGLEWLRVDSTRPARAFDGDPAHEIETAWFAVVRWSS